MSLSLLGEICLALQSNIWISFTLNDEKAAEAKHLKVAKVAVEVREDAGAHAEEGFDPCISRTGKSPQNVPLTARAYFRFEGPFHCEVLYDIQPPREYFQAPWHISCIIFFVDFLYILQPVPLQFRLLLLV